MKILSLFIIAIAALSLNCSKGASPSKVEIFLTPGDSVKVGNQVVTLVKLPQALRDLNANENTEIRIAWNDDIRAAAVTDAMQTLTFHNFKKISVQTKSNM